MISESIKELRELNGMTQTTLAQRLGMSRTAVNSWEMGTSVPSTQYIVEMTRIFGISADYLLGTESKLSIDISSLSSRERKLLFELVDMLKSKGKK